ncbi:MAG: hypothetical protein SWK90_14270 [Chloroflexota bacterium]|nr:hypothetical protein [Chloroflexota bacterium]
MDELTNGWQPLDVLLLIGAAVVGLLVVRYAKQILHFLLILGGLLVLVVLVVVATYALDLWQMPALLDVLEVVR